MAHVEGSGTALSTTSVKFWFAPPAPHVHSYVPGVTPRVLKVWPLKIEASESGAPET